MFVLENGADPGEAPALDAYILWSIWLSTYSTTNIVCFLICQRNLTIALQTLRRLTIFDALCHTYWTSIESHIFKGLPVIISIKWGIFLFRYLSKQCKPDWIFLNGSITAEHYFWSNDSGLMYIWHQFVRKLNSWIYYTHLYWLIWFFMSKRTFFSVMSGRVVLGWTTKQGLMCLAKGHNTVGKMFLWTQVKS